MALSSSWLQPVAVALTCLIAAACETPTAVTLVNLRTDMRPGLEFDRVAVALYPGGTSASFDVPARAAPVVTVTRTRDALAGFRVAEFDNLTHGNWLVEGRLLSAEIEVGRGRTLVRVDGASQLVTLRITRNCMGVDCPGDGSPSDIACLGGRCVDPRCSPETPDRCPPEQCMEDEACASELTSVPCARGLCLSGVCGTWLDDGRCGEGGVCLPELGCSEGVDAGPPAPDRWDFVDDDQRTFDRGDYLGGELPLTWNETQVELLGPTPFDSTASGLFVSSLFDTGEAGAIWETLTWLPEAPAGRALPDGGGRDPAGYLAGEIDMTGNILLLHLDDATWTDGATVADSSGAAHHGVLRFNGQRASSVAGAFGRALDIDRDAWVTLDGDDFAFGNDDFTYSVWVKMRDCSASNDNRIAMGGGDADDGPHIWIGALCPEACPGGDGVFMNFLADTREGPTLSTCAGVVLTDGDWHHLAGVKRGHSPATVLLFVDGREVARDTYDYAGASLSYSGGEIRLGGFNLGGTRYDTSIVVDEAAIWRRALSEREVEALYRRGGARLELQVRSCAGSSCDSEPFRGPDGTSSTFFTESDLAGDPGSQDGNLLPLELIGDTAQYRVRFTTGHPLISPGLRRVSLRAVRP